MDGIAAALLANYLLTKMGYQVEVENVRPTSHYNLESIELDREDLYFFVDIRPPPIAVNVGGAKGISQHPDQKNDAIYKNVFCVDHHTTPDTPPSPIPNFFLHNYESDTILPSTATFLMYYLIMVEKGIEKSYDDTLDEWMNSPPKNTIYLLLQAVIADHIHLLSEISHENPLRTFTRRHLDDKLDNYVKLSITTSLLLGRKQEPMSQFSKLLSIPLGQIDETMFNGMMKGKMNGVERLFKFVNELKKQIEEFFHNTQQELGDQISTLREEINSRNEMLEKFHQAMKLGEMEMDEQHYPTRETMENTADIEKTAIQQKKMERERERERARLKILEAKQDVTKIEDSRGLAIFLPPQENDQVRGILSSLLFHNGLNNIVLEEKSSNAVWSSRGYGGEQLERFLTTVSVDFKEMVEFREYHEAREKLIETDPALLSTLDMDSNYEPNITIENRYVGQMGGRCKIFGGIVSSSIHLDNTHTNTFEMGLGSGSLDAIPHQRYWRPTIQAIKEKFKKNDWFTVQVEGGSLNGNIIKDKWELLLFHFVGKNLTTRK